MLHWIGSIAAFLASNMIFALMFSLGLGFELGDRYQRASGRTVAATVITTYVVNPGLAILAVAILPFGPIGVATLLLMSISPGAPGFLIKASKLGSGLHKGIFLAGAVSIVSVFYIPIALWGMGRYFNLDLAVSPGSVLNLTVIGVLAPFVAGAFLRWAAPNLAKKVAPLATVFFQAALFVVVALLAIVGLPLLMRLPMWVYFAMFALTFASAYSAFALSSRDPVERKLSVPASVMSNPAIALYVAARVFPPGLSILPAVAAYLLIRALMMGLFMKWISGRIPEEQVSASEEPERLAG